MPIYEYTCNDCNTNFDSLVTSSDDVINCPKCESKSLEKLFSTFGVKSQADFGSSSSEMKSVGGCTPATCGCGAFH